jgi:sec-independent protein translocase protein TatA
MFTGHLWELVVVLIIALVLFGPKRLPEIGSSVGKGIREFRGAIAGIGEGEHREGVGPTTERVTDLTSR